MRTTSLTAVASWSSQSVTRVLTTRWRWGRRGRPAGVGLAQGVVALERAGARHARRRRRGSTWRRRRRSGRRRARGCTRAIVARTPSATSANVIVLIASPCRRCVYRPVGLNASSATTRRKHAVDQKWSALPVPYAIEVPDRAPKERYYDPDFYELEAEQLWPRVWQMACRLEEIPEPGDFVSTRSSTSRSSCCAPTTARCGRSRTPAATGASGSSRAGARCESGFTCPFHGWCYGQDGANTRIPHARSRSASTTCEPGDIDLTPVRCELWGGCAWINLDDGAPPLRRVHRAGRHHPRRLEGRVAAHRVVVRLPPPGELEARPAGVPGAVPRGGGPPAAGHPRHAVRARRARRSTRGRSSTPRSGTCAR